MFYAKTFAKMFYAKTFAKMFYAKTFAKMLAVSCLLPDIHEPASFQPITVFPLLT